MMISNETCVPFVFSHLHVALMHRPDTYVKVGTFDLLVVDLLPDEDRKNKLNREIPKADGAHRRHLSRNRTSGTLLNKINPLPLAVCLKIVCAVRRSKHYFNYCFDIIVKPICAVP